MNGMTTLFNEWDDTSFRNSTVHGVVMYAITIRACTNQYLAPIFKRNRELSIEHGVLETDLLCSKPCMEISFSQEILFIKKGQVMDTTAKQISVLWFLN
jgi:hypothetical protein